VSQLDDKHGHLSFRNLAIFVAVDFIKVLFDLFLGVGQFALVLGSEGSF